MDSKIEEADLGNEATNNEETKAKGTECKNCTKLEKMEGELSSIKTNFTRSERMLVSLICINIFILSQVMNWQGIYLLRE